MTITQTGFKRDVQGVYIVKDPGSTITYTLDWSEWLAQGSNISASTWTVSTVTGDGNLALSQVSSGITQNATYTYVELQRGTHGNTYVIKNTITTDAGTVDVRRFRVRVEDRYL